MNTIFKQAERLGRLTTVAGNNVLTLLRFDGTDYLNGLFEYRVEALATEPDIDFDKLIGTHATVAIEGIEGTRQFDGIVTQTRWAGVGENGHRYDLILRPWFWLTGLRRNQRIFHNKTVVDILQELLSDYSDLGDPALEMRLSGDYPELEYTVQYRESDLDFALRQMERHGISYHFIHKAGSHTLVLTDDVLAHDLIGERRFKSYDGHHQAEGEHFWEWAPERNMTTGVVRLIDYNFKQPEQAMEADRTGDAAYAHGQIESFDFPGDFLNQDAGKIVAGLRVAQERGLDRRIRATGDALSLGSGLRTVLGGDPVPGTGETYVCISASHHFVSEAYGTGDTASDGYSFTGQYTLMPDTAPMIPPRRAPAPVVGGPQTAMVVGDGEIDCDEYGRILVRFHWDVDNAYSMRCRVSQNWAGGGWGGMVIPRIGMEVLVEFLEGNPDRPIVVGNVFNGKNNAPYPLPENKTKMVMRSQTHQGSGFNELSFEDQAGSEEIFMHGQKDHRVQILNDQNQNIGNDRSKTVGNNQTESVGNDKTISVGNNHSESITKDKNMTVGGSHSESITGKMDVTVTGDMSETVKSARTLTVTGDDTTTVETGNHSLTVKTGNQETTVAAGDHIVQVKTGGQQTVVQQDCIIQSKAGMVFIKASKGIILESPSILLKSDSKNFIQIAGGQLVIEGAETHVNPRITAPDTEPTAPAPRTGGKGPSMV